MTARKVLVHSLVNLSTQWQQRVKRIFGFRMLINSNCSHIKHPSQLWFLWLFYLSTVSTFRLVRYYSLPGCFERGEKSLTICNQIINECAVVSVTFGICWCLFSKVWYPLWAGDSFSIGMYTHTFWYDNEEIWA